MINNGGEFGGMKYTALSHKEEFLRESLFSVKLPYL